MQLLSIHPAILPIADVDFARYGTGRPFDVSQAGDSRNGQIIKRELREMLGQLHACDRTPMTGMAPGTQAMTIAPMPRAAGPIGGEKDTTYWTYEDDNRGRNPIPPVLAAAAAVSVALISRPTAGRAGVKKITDHGCVDLIFCLAMSGTKFRRSKKSNHELTGVGVKRLHKLEKKRGYIALRETGIDESKRLLLDC